MRTITSDTTGGLVSGRIRTTWLESEWVPMPNCSPSRFCEYLNWWLTECTPSQLGGRAHRERLRLQLPKKNIFAHQDLALHNIMVDEHRNLWLIDWGFSGFYPAISEYASLSRRKLGWGKTWSDWWVRMQWDLFRLIALGPLNAYRGERSLDFLNFFTVTHVM